MRRLSILLLIVIFLAACVNDADNNGLEKAEKNTDVKSTEGYKANIEIEFHESADGNKHMTIAGKTNLPNGEEVIASVVSEENDYTANDTYEVMDGLYTVGPFSKGGESLPSGEYIIKIKSKSDDRLEETKTVTIE